VATRKSRQKSENTIHFLPKIIIMQTFDKINSKRINILLTGLDMHVTMDAKGVANSANMRHFYNLIK